MDYSSIDIYNIQVEIPTGSKTISIGDQAFLRDKEIVTIFKSNLSITSEGNTVRNTNYFLELFSGDFNKATVPSTFLDPDLNNTFNYDSRGISWQKCNIVLPTPATTTEYVDLYVIYKS